MLKPILLTLILATALPCAATTTLHGRVVGVLDGDTISLLGTDLQQYRIRLAEIDAPEKSQSYGQKSKWSLSALAFGRQATAECSKPDRYQRHVCHVYIGNTNINASQVESGMAWVYTNYAAKNSPLFGLEQKAKESRTGLWGDQSPTPPWEYRRNSK